MVAVTTVDGDQRLVVVGLGYVGLQLATAAASTGMRVDGVDIDPTVVARLRRAESHIDDVPSATVATLLAGGNLRFTEDLSVAEHADVVAICVPTPLDAHGDPDTDSIARAARSLARHLRPGTLVVLESTSYPGTTEGLVQPALEASGLHAGRDFHLAFSSERIDPGNERFHVRNTPKVVGGLTERCTDRAVALYERIASEVVRAAGIPEAEMSKLLENTYRYVNIALVNELAQVCERLSIDVWDVIRCAATKPFGFHSFSPGPGVGGHCIPVDPHYLRWLTRQATDRDFRMISAAQSVNDGMPDYVADRIAAALTEDGVDVRGARVLLLGVTYKPDVADDRESPAYDLAAELARRGAQLVYHDPFVTSWTRPDATADRAEDLEQELAKADISVLVQPHAVYRSLPLSTARRVFDPHGTLTGPTVVRL
ncbi:UDP-N-acetyl-D-glucosamine dehydrogenase [Cellulomonas biazotea]|uniref:UDP-N-acetyl-D-glucosamine dehydrogenase n=1 Tax=Cellulomonas biazotea TaxID=1709 RepID=A0A402DMV5_9CELL|nr:UDP-N-acetyl-D-glucosamine dehydrogenase [Cellulomonas biazotea]